MLFAGAYSFWGLNFLRTRVSLYPSGFAVLQWGRVQEFPWSRVIEVCLERPGTPAPFNLQQKVVRDDGEEFAFIDTDWDELENVVESEARARGIRITVVEVIGGGTW